MKLDFTRTTRVIDRLRELYPGKWTWDRYLQRWVHEDGSYVEARACLAPEYDGDDDTFVTRYYRYFPDKRRPTEWVHL